MARFCDFGVDEMAAVVGKKIEIDELFNRRILIEKAIIKPTKYPGKNSSGLRMQMQVCLATFYESPDENGDYFRKDANGSPDGERRSCFTGSDVLISAIQNAEARMPEINEQRAAKGLSPISVYPIDTTIVKVGKCFKFT